MKKIAALLVLFGCWRAVQAQQVNFVYLQAEGAQPFFLKMNEQVHSSNGSGYLILSKLRDTTYTFSIGFPQNKWPEQSFSLTMAGKDRGFLVKKGEDNNWNLVDLQTEQRITGELGGLRSVRTEPKEVSAFTDVLSKAANDPSLKVRVIPVKPAEKTETKTNAVAAVKEDRTAPALAKAPDSKEQPIPDSAAIVQKVTADSAALADAAVQQAPNETLKKVQEQQSQETAKIDISVKDTLVRRIGDPSAGGINIITEAKKDSIEGKLAQQPLTQTVADSAAPSVAVREKPVTVQSPAVEKKEELPAAAEAAYQPSHVKRRTESSTTEGFGITYVDEYPDGKKDTIQILIPNPKVITRNVPPPQEDGQFLPMDSDAKDLTPARLDNAARKDCNAMASETDYLKLRKKMVSTDGDDAMLAAAKKVFKTKCFTTEQLKNLGTLFLNDAGRYNFFDAAYLSVSDPGNFSGLETELKDPYYISRFKAMLR